MRLKALDGELHYPQARKNTPAPTPHYFQEVGKWKQQSFLTERGRSHPNVLSLL